MRKIVLLIIVSLLFFSCNFVGNKTNSSDILEELKLQKAKIDTLYKYHKYNVLTFVQLTENSLPFKIDSTFDDDYFTVFTLQKDSSGKIISASEFPYIRSGDMYLVLTHYFNENGQTFAYEKQFNTFHCLNGIGFETTTDYYNSDFQLINKEYKLIDENGKPISKDSCMLTDYGFKVFPTINKYLKEKRIKNLINN